MLLRKTSWFWKSGLAAISFVLILSISGCSDAPPEENTVSETVIDVQAIQEESEEDADEIISVCIDLYEKAEEENKLADLETIRSIVNRLGENGYSAVDSRNQINMTEPEKVVEFCEKVDAQEEAEITILEISYLGGFVKYDLHTKDGNVDVVRSYYKYENGNMKREVTGNYQAEYWNYTEEGYLMFSGVWFSEELYVLTLSGAEEHTALRVLPLDETYRELSRKYLRPIGFEQNNMFIVDWSEEDFGDLNFYDIPDEEYYPTMEEALQKADVYYDEYEPYQKNIDNLLVDMENDQYRFIYYQSIQKKKSMNTFATFKIREVNDEKRYAFLRSYVRDSEKFYKGIGDADKNTKAQLARSDYMQHYGIDKDARFVFGDIMEEELKKGESAEALTVEGQKPDAVIPYEENGKKWYFWYFTDLQSDKEGNELEYTLKQ